MSVSFEEGLLDSHPSLIYYQLTPTIICLYLVFTLLTHVDMNKAIKGAFIMAWRELMGFDFPTTPIDIKGEDLRDWPTIIIQLQGARHLTGDEEFDVSHPEKVPNKAAILDPEHPDDILIALPPSHYMEYSFRNRTYFSRFEFAGGGENSAVGP